MNKLFICLIKISLLFRIFVILLKNEPEKIFKIINIFSGLYILDKYK